MRITLLTLPDIVSPLSLVVFCDPIGPACILSRMLSPRYREVMPGLAHGFDPARHYGQPIVNEPGQ